MWWISRSRDTRFSGGTNSVIAGSKAKVSISPNGVGGPPTVRRVATICSTSVISPFSILSRAVR